MSARNYLRTSLAGRIFLAFIIPAIAAMVALSSVNYYSTFGGLQLADDKTLRVFSRLITQNVRIDDGRVVFDIPEKMLENLNGDHQDTIFYSIRHQGRAIYSSGDIILDDNVSTIRWGNKYYDGYVNNHRARIIEITPDIHNDDGQILVYIASDYSAKPNYRWLMSWIYIINGTAFLLILIAIIWLSVRWAIRPLSGLKEEIKSRSVYDDKPISTEHVPLELQSIVHAFNNLIHRLQHLLLATRRFTADASHQMRTPLSVLRTHIEVLRHEGLDGPMQQSSLADIEAAAAGLERLLTQLLALARADDAQPAQIAELFGEVDLVAIARSVAESQVGNALERGIDLQFEPQQTRIPTRTVDMLAREMMANLLDNAIRYNQRGGSVLFSVRRSQGGAQVVIEDDGSGIPPDDIDRMCERFARLPRDRNEAGSGLGLAIVFALAKAIDAAVTLTPRPEGIGLKAEILFPDK